jgi:hypothetical protein
LVISPTISVVVDLPFSPAKRIQLTTGLSGVDQVAEAVHGVFPLDGPLDVYRDPSGWCPVR